jgi:DNA-binding NtrC family response regulator
MVTVPVSVLPFASRVRPRTALVASADRSFRQRLSETLTGLRWQVREAEGGAQAWAEAESAAPEAVIVDSWLPDLDLAEFLKDFRAFFPEVDLLTTSGSITQESPRGPYRQELLYALRRTQDNDTAIWNAAPALNSLNPPPDSNQATPWPIPAIPAAAPPAFPPQSVSPEEAHSQSATPKPLPIVMTLPVTGIEPKSCERLPDLIGNAPCMIDVSRRVRLVAPRSTPVLIEGPTGSGKELVAEALHRLSTRSRKPFVAINCAAIPEALLEAELFGHTRGAFTGAVQGRVGRIEAADGGTLFLDEIGEMPLGLQSKLLRFVECGELQRVGDNETVRVDVRIIAATHQALAAQAQNGGFRADLYYRLAVFLIRTPALAEHTGDLPLLVDHFLAQMGREAPIKRLDEEALTKLSSHDWPGNVRELEHVLERAAILAGEESVVTAREIDFGLTIN